MTLCDIGDVFTIPANLEKSFDQISNAVAHIASTGTMPIILGGDHSIGFPTVRGLASVTSKNIGIIHVDRHADIQEKDLDERMHTTPYFHATNLPNVNPKNLVQIGIGGWQVPRPAVPNMIERETNIFTMDDIETMGIEKVAEMALELAWKDCDAVYLSYDIDSIEAGFVPGYVVFSVFCASMCVLYGYCPDLLKLKISNVISPFSKPTELVGQNLVVSFLARH